MLTYNPPKSKTIGVVDEYDNLFDDAVKFIHEVGLASATNLQRQFKIGYARAARFLDELEQKGIVGKANGAKPREILTKDNRPEAVKVEFEDTLAKWCKTKYADDKSDNFEIELGANKNNKQIKLNLEHYGNLLVVGTQYTSAVDLLNNILATTLSRYSPDELRLIVIDGASGDIILPNQSSHLLTPVIIDPQKSISALKWAVLEIERRSMAENQNNLPHVLILINSFNQIAYFSPTEVEINLYQIVTRGRKYGVYLIIATDFINPKSLKSVVANNPAKITFKSLSLPETEALKSPEQAIFDTLFDGQQLITINKIDPTKIYEEIYK